MRQWLLAGANSHNLRHTIFNPVLVQFQSDQPNRLCVFRTSLESMTDRVTLTDYEARRLLNAIVKEFVQMTSEELEQQANEGNSSVTAQKRACNTATCVTHRLADFLNRSGGMGNSNFVPTNVGAKAFGRRRRDSPMTAPM
uniref:Calcitonin related polypeptide beta n=1 Tax=Hucho hucho TaxID=62062 RepID=A0A4W5R0F8_9TELE